MVPEDLRGDWTFATIAPGEWQAEGFSVMAREVPHKGGRTFGYRISDGRSTLTYIPDHCPTAFGPGPDGLGEYHPVAIELAADTDLLVHDAQLFPAEVAADAQYGHAAADYGVALGALAGARSVTMFHHRPDRTDAALDELAARFSGEPGVSVAGRTRDRSVSGWSARPVSASSPDAVVVGSGPNGLAAALTLARGGLAVEIFEGAETPAAAAAPEELTLPGFVHDVCSTVHPLLAASPFFVQEALEGLTLAQPEVAFAHPLDGGVAASAVISLEQTASSLGRDAGAYRRLLGPLIDHAQAIVPTVLAPLLTPRPTRWRWRASACAGCGRRQCSPAASTPGRPARCSPAWRRTPCAHSARRARAPSRCCWGCSRTRSAGRWCRAAARASPRR